MLRLSALRQASAKSSNVMELLHNCLGHVSMAIIEQLTKQRVDVGIKLNTASLSQYDCVPGIESKFTRMHHARNTLRLTCPLAKVLVDTCTINVSTAYNETMFLLIVNEAIRYK